MDDFETPFHAGELALQDMVGARARVHSYAPRMIRPFLPDQHRVFYRELPYLFVGAVDHDSQPWATVWFGDPGFVGSPDAYTLSIADVRQEGDPVSACVVEGAELGFLGLALHNRRRNRVNGRVAQGSENQVTIKVSQSFGNCPKYIQKRIFAPLEPREKSPVLVENRSVFSEEDLRMIEQADTFFIASIAARPSENAKRGVDVSHRGGKPRFVKALSDGRLIIPDFAGNNHFNTLGNIHETGTAGLLFIDFQTGDVLQATGEAELLWPDECEWFYGGAERYLMFSPQKVVRRNSAVPIGWYLIDASPFIPDGGPWQKIGVRL